MNVEDAIAREERQERIVDRANRIVCDVMATLSGRDALIAMVGSEDVAELLAEAADGDYVMAVHHQALVVAERELAISSGA